ncbi:MAG: TIGR03936 family radical SAM-associated protein [Arachnia propionica]|uniref:TIGR03936 family radical SAM-associated protein n=1 Tax=Arachnia propionica TaxID=1750 RepID=UPI00270ED085|nr:TIGR03936 family radical SAM-associated protein [Arachnia propionica]
MAKKQPPIQQAPPVQRVRLRYARRGAARFTSHRDFGRILERALRRAAVPMAYSSGFNPHPRISYANSAPTSAASEAEYVELALAAECDPAKVQRALNAVMPQGLVFLEAADAVRESLSDLLEASDWEAAVADCPPGSLARAAVALLDSTTETVERMTKSGMRSFDVRQAVMVLSVPDDQHVVMRLRHLTPLVRPDDVMTVLRRLEPGIPATPALLTRLRQGPLVETGIGDPLNPKPVEQ